MNDHERVATVKVAGMGRMLCSYTLSVNLECNFLCVASCGNLRVGFLMYDKVVEGIHQQMKHRGDRAIFCMTNVCIRDSLTHSEEYPGDHMIIAFEIFECQKACCLCIPKVDLRIND